MTRVTRRTTSVLARRSPSRITKRNLRKHKVILESVTQAKKKLRSVISFEAKAPPGYTFIPAGNPHFTTACKELCRKDGMKVYAVSTTPHLHTHGLSQHVHRIGYHFPSATVAAVCMDRGLYLTSTGKTVPFYGTGNDTGPAETNSVSQITINTEARDVLKDLFPNIPDNDLNQIIKTAFQKGQRKVGTAVELPLARRAQLAVVAHIRHIYTNYDRLLKTTSFHEARATVEQPTLAKLVEWRGDDENGKTVLEDVFREVIVISDDEDSDIESEPQPLHGRDTSVEVISSNPVVEELQMRPLDHDGAALRGTHFENLEDEAPPGFRFIPEVPKRAKIDRRGFSRYQAWDRAINRYKNYRGGPGQQAPSYSVEGDRLQENRGSDREPSLRRPIGNRHPSGTPLIISNHRAVTTTNPSRPPLQPMAEHRRYELYPLSELPSKRKDALVSPKPPNLVPPERAPIPDAVRPSFHQSDLTNRPVFVSGPKDIIHERHEDTLRSPPRPPGRLHSRNVSQQDRVLPSIESPIPVEIKRPSSGHIEHLTKRLSGAFNFRSVTPHRQIHQDFPNHPIPQEPVQDHASKRRRMAYYEPTPMENALPSHTPPALSVYPGERYVPAEQPVLHSGTSRGFVASVEPPHIAKHRPDTIQGPSLPFARFDREAPIPAHQGPSWDYDAQLFPPGRLVNPHVSRRESPGQPQPRIKPDTTYGQPVGTSGRDGSFQPRLPDAPEPRTLQCVHEHIAGGYRRRKITKPQHEPVRRSRDSHVPYKPIENQSTYAAGFVRPVDHRDPSVSSEHRQSHRLPPSQIMVMHQPHLAVELTLDLRPKLSLCNIQLSAAQDRDIVRTGNIQPHLQSTSITDSRRITYPFHGRLTTAINAHTPPMSDHLLSI
ncbi:hypothetical protein ASPCAL14515 [Aspergillus calidoustus]|uniref:DUF2293 domain-containing protein n=1 Tax=Aspergillus calidoustus TaxID=454130 RepID=A0A0U4ZQ05_ASPCI|nr:hypothetical protein ASPCAL14515 [Aspergillus calidoustus]